MTDLLVARAGLADARIRGLEQDTRLSPQQDKALLQQAQKFEGFLLNMLMTSMRKTIHKSKMLDGGQAEQIYTGMFDKAVTEQASSVGQGIGIAQMIYDQLAPLARQSKQIAGQLGLQKDAEGTPNDR